MRSERSDPSSTDELGPLVPRHRVTLGGGKLDQPPSEHTENEPERTDEGGIIDA